MKKVIFGLIATLMFSFVGNAQRFKSSDFVNVAKEHNDILNIAYNGIKEKKASNNKELNLFLQNYIKTNNSYKNNEELLLSQKNINKSFINPINIAENLYSNEFSNNISTNVKNYLNKLNNVIDLNYNSKDNLNRSIIELENQIDKDLSLKNNDLCILFSATNVAKGSNEYWSLNSDKWSSLNATTMASKKGAGGRIVKADVAGAVAGACAAWAANLVPGAGQVAYGSSIAGWAAGCSAYQATMEILDSWF